MDSHSQMLMVAKRKQFVGGPLRIMKLLGCSCLGLASFSVREGRSQWSPVTETYCEDPVGPQGGGGCVTCCKQDGCY